MIIRNEEDLTRAVLRVMERTLDPRLREIMVSLIRHLHGFVREVRLTEAEFEAATALLNEIGQQQTDTNNEVVLMAGSLGVSSLICLLNTSDRSETNQSMLGPFWRLNSPSTENGGSIVRSPTPGPRVFVELHYVDMTEKPLGGVEADVWHASTVGLYESQDAAQADMNLRGKFISDDHGSIRFVSIKPAGYPVPTDGVVGRLLTAQRRHPFRPAHLHALARKAGFKTLISQLYSADDPRLDDDVQFGVTPDSIGDYQRHDEPHPTDRSVQPPWYALEHTLTMETGESRLPRAPIK